MKYVYSCTYALAALLVAGICLQSCTKKNSLTPSTPTVKNTSTPSRVNYADSLRGTKWSGIADTIEFYGKDSFLTTNINVLFSVFTFPPNQGCPPFCCCPPNRNTAKGLYALTNDSLLAMNVRCVCPNYPPCPNDICGLRQAVFQIVALDSERLLISKKDDDIIPPRSPNIQTDKNLYIYRRIR